MRFMFGKTSLLKFSFYLDFYITFCNCSCNGPNLSLGGTSYRLVDWVEGTM